MIFMKYARRRKGLLRDQNIQSRVFSSQCGLYNAKGIIFEVFETKLTSELYITNELKKTKIYNRDLVIKSLESSLIKTDIIDKLKGQE
ncbi:hypothetical protein Glove_221g85 [Diversispora epigaea]|uniref:Uncharacterized protein n=1 Tax=Diversispora epigaea TaxID=1348612 RepID=A0A397IFN0_9GLOM|nr:hypothetical protein Glove_221g85 [Diversispora epigaea]